MTAARDAAAVRGLLAAVHDPELPEISILDLGIVREVNLGDGGCEVVLTPTYSGCPAYGEIEAGIVATLEAAGVPAPRVSRRFRPPWTSDWLSDRARRILRGIGIAPPGAAPADGAVVHLYDGAVACPRCGGRATRTVSAFGATACKSLHHCAGCAEPFEHFKAV